MITYKQLFITKFNLKVTVAQYLIYTFILVSRIDFHRALGPCLSSLLKYENIPFWVYSYYRNANEKILTWYFFSSAVTCFKGSSWFLVLTLLNCHLIFFIFSNSYQASFSVLLYILHPQNGFSSSHVWIWELDYKESWAQKNWCFWTVVLEKTLESLLD